MKTTTQQTQDEAKNIKYFSEHILQIIAFEFSDKYSLGMSEEDFIDNVYENIEQVSRSREGTAFFKKVYKYLKTHEEDNDIDNFNVIDEFDDNQISYSIIDKSILPTIDEAIIVSE